MSKIHDEIQLDLLNIRLIRYNQLIRYAKLQNINLSRAIAKREAIRREIAELEQKIKQYK